MERDVTPSYTETLVLKTSTLDDANTNKNSMANTNHGGTHSPVHMDKTTVKFSLKEKPETDSCAERSKASGVTTHSDQLTDTYLNNLKKYRDILKVMELNKTDIQNKRLSEK